MDGLNDNIGAGVSGPGAATSFFDKAGMMAYNEICYNNVHNNISINWAEKWNLENFSPYASYNDDQWVSYDNVETVIAKLHLMRERSLGGVNYLTIDRDDFSNYLALKLFQ